VGRAVGESRRRVVTTLRFTSHWETPTEIGEKEGLKCEPYTRGKKKTVKVSHGFVITDLTTGGERQGLHPERKGESWNYHEVGLKSRKV